MISKKYKCIFLHPNKCGGKSIEHALFNTIPGSKSDHSLLTRYRDVYGDLVDKYFKFMFCRNPWNRLVSIYFGRKQILKIEMPSFEDFIKSSHPEKSPTAAQIMWIKDTNGKVNVDFIGRFERYDEDWKKVCEKLSINKELPHLNKSEHKPYQEYYSDELRKIVANKYKEDIDYFGYEYK